MRDICPALRDATDEEGPVIRRGTKVLPDRTAGTALMDVSYVLNESARQVVGRYVDIS